MKNIIFTFLAFTAITQSVIAAGTPTPSDIAAENKVLTDAVKKNTGNEIINTKSGSVVIPSNAKTTSLTSTRANDGPITMKDFTDKSIYKFYYPEVCDVDYDVNSPSVSVRCPNTHGFSKYELIYGSGNASNEVFDNITQLNFPADNAWHKQTVKKAPYQSNKYWTNFKVIPLF